MGALFVILTFVDGALSVSTRVSAGVAAAPAIAWQGVFMPGIVTGIAHVALPVPCFVSMEVVEWLGTMFGQRSVVTMTRIVAVVDMTVKARMAMKPWPGSDKDTTQKPIGAVVAVRCAVIGSVIEVTIGAHRRGPNADRDLGTRRRCGTEQRHG